MEELRDENQPIECPFVAGVVKELKGLEYGGERTVTCMSCNKPLFVVMKVSDKPTELLLGKNTTAYIETNKFISNCPYCDGDSWIVSVKGQLMIAPIMDETLVVAYEEEEPNLEESIMITRVKIEKVK